MKNNIIFALLLTLFSSPLMAQVNCAGVVTGDLNEPLVGVLVSVENTDLNTVTDEAGAYTLEVAGYPVTLHFEYLGFVDFDKTFAQADIQTIQLKESPIIINEILIKESVPNQFAIDGAKEVQNAKTVNDLFGDITGFNLVKRSNYATEPVLRGFKYERLNIQYDGAAKIVHACPNHMDPITSHVIPEEIEKIEIVKGPFDVRYGAVLGGIVNLVTARPDRLNAGLHGNVSLGYGTNGSNVSTTGSVAYVKDKVDVMLDGSFRDYGNYTDGNGVEVPASFKTTDAAIKFGFNPNANQRLQANYRYSSTKDIMHPGLPMDSPHDDGQMVGLDYSIRNISSKFSKFTAKTYYSYVDHLMTNELRKNFKIVGASTPVFSKVYGGKMEALLTPNAKTFLYLGADFTSTNRTGDRTRKLKRSPMNPDVVFDPPKIFVDSVWGNSTIADFGLYGQAKFFLTDKFVLQTGIRADFVTGNIAEPAKELKKYYGKIEDQKDANISAHVTAAYELAPKTELKLSLGRGVRSGNMIERYINHFAVGSDAYELVGNPNLKPETNHQIELALAGNINGFSYGVSGFYARLKDYIMAEIDTNITRKFTPNKKPKYVKRFNNIDEATKIGFELNAGYKFANYWLINADVAYTKGQQTEGDLALPQIAPIESNISFGYKSNKYWGLANIRMVGKQEEVSKAFGEVPSESFNLVGLNFGAVWKGLTLGLAVDNLFDQAYYEHLNFRYKNSRTNEGFILEQGRNVSIFAKYKF